MLRTLPFPTAGEAMPPQSKPECSHLHPNSPGDRCCLLSALCQALVAVQRVWFTLRGLLVFCVYLHSCSTLCLSKAVHPFPTRGVCPEEILFIEQPKSSTKPTITCKTPTLLSPLPTRECKNYNKRSSASPEPSPSQNQDPHLPYASLVKNTHPWAILEGCSSDKELLYQLQSNSISLPLPVDQGHATSCSPLTVTVTKASLWTSHCSQFSKMGAYNLGTLGL